ncbi:hypothetical protein T4E_12214 [Trichinella pseudospiralis]|uniref:Uncharacterized protein n=1 Tax=Trichinella pseudospiralis TaxID=6337 RepID=A0A0V0XPV7_TRIPS|nr:hypothetical protein T4E_12214 [Trichinella pseudospiralis]
MNVITRSVAILAFDVNDGIWESAVMRTNMRVSIKMDCSVQWPHQLVWLFWFWWRSQCNTFKVGLSSVFP